MFEDMDFATIEKEKLDYISEQYPKLDVRSGSLVHVATAGNSYEDSMIFLCMDYLLRNTFASTADRFYLKLRAADRGLYPRSATSAVALGVFTNADGSGKTDIAVGERFTCDKYMWTITERKSDGEYLLTCETTGEAPNGCLSKLIPTQNIEGLSTATLDSIRIYGEEEEDTEAFRQRYLDSFKNVAYGFNRIEYIQVVNALEGVGAVKPFRATKVSKYGIIEKDCPGHVTLAILSSRYDTPTQELIDYVQTTIDPTQNKGEGIGLAPIDHEVHVISAETRNVSVGLNIVFIEGCSFSDCKTVIEEVIESYFKSLNEKWADDAITVRVAQIESRILALDDYVVDVQFATIDGARGNVTLDALEIVGLSEVTEIESL